MSKDGDIILNNLKRAAKRLESIEIILFSSLYKPPWWYWLDYLKTVRN